MSAGFLEGLGISLHGLPGAYQMVNPLFICQLMKVSEREIANLSMRTDGIHPADSRLKLYTGLAI
jgi:hypothetical protein